LLLFGGEESVSEDEGRSPEDDRLDDGLLEGLRAAGRDDLAVLLVVREAAGFADDLLVVLLVLDVLVLVLPLVLDVPLVLRAPDDAVAVAAGRDREDEALGLLVPLARDAVAAAGLAVDIAFAAALSAFAAVDIDLVAVFIARIALDIVFAELLALVAATVILLAADVTFVAADDTVRAAVAAVAPFLAAVRVDRAAVDRAAVDREAVDREAVDLEAVDLEAEDRDDAGREDALRDRDALLRLVDDVLREGVVRDALVVLELDPGRRAVPLDALRLTDPLRAVLVVLRRVAARVVV
jgi:hypothetical protein